MDKASWAKARADMYRFLSAVFLEPPTKALIDSLLADGFIEELEELFGFDTVRDLREFATRFDGDYEGLDQEFHDLFMVPLGRYVTPYEAVYRDEREIGDERVSGLLMGPSTLAVKQLYRDAGIVVSEDFKDLPDHVGLELACMGFLCDAENAARRQNDADAAARMRKMQQRFFHEHLTVWLPALCGRIRENSSGPFYRGIANLTEAYLRQDSEALDC